MHDPAAGASDIHPLGVPDLPPPKGLSAYTFATSHHALKLPMNLGLIAMVIVVAHVFAMLVYFKFTDGEGESRVPYYFLSVFDLWQEESFGTYFSALTLLFIGRVLWGHAKQSRAAQQVWSLWWFALAVIFHILSIEEVVDLHAMITEYKQRAVEGESAVRWTAEGFWLTMVVGAAFLPFLWHVPRRFALFCFLGAAIYVVGALGVDTWAPRGEEGNSSWVIGYRMWVGLEEGMEMAGPLVFLHGLLAYLAGNPRGTITEYSAVEP